MCVKFATIAQLVERTPCKRQVMGRSLLVALILITKCKWI